MNYKIFVIYVTRIIVNLMNFFHFVSKLLKLFLNICKRGKNSHTLRYIGSKVFFEWILFGLICFIGYIVFSWNELFKKFKKILNKLKSMAF